MIEYNYWCNACDTDIVSDNPSLKTCPHCASQDVDEVCPMCCNKINTDTKYCSTCKEIVG